MHYTVMRYLTHGSKCMCAPCLNAVKLSLVRCIHVEDVEEDETISVHARSSK